MISEPRNHVTMPNKWQSIAMVLSSGLISAGGPASTGVTGGGGGGLGGGGFDDIGKSPMFEAVDQNRFVILQNPICFVKQTAA